MHKFRFSLLAMFAFVAFVAVVAVACAALARPSQLWLVVVAGSRTQERTIMHNPANNRPNVLPANVSNLRDELQRLAAAGNPDGRGVRNQVPTQDSTAMVSRGK